MRTISETYIGIGLLEQARALLLKSVEFGRPDLRVKRLDLARALEALGNTELSMGHQDAAGRNFAEALSIRVAIDQQQTDEGVRLLTSIAASQRARQHFPEALQTLRQAEELAEQLALPDPTVLGQVYMGYGMTYSFAGDFRKAEDYSRRSLPLLKGVVHAGYDLYANSLATLGSALRRQYRTSEAEAIYRELLDRQRQRYGADHYLIGRALNNYALLLSTEGKLQAAEEALLEAVRIIKKNPESNPSALAITHYNLGALHRTAGELPRALQALNSSVEVWRSMPGKYSSNLVQTLVEKSATLREQGQLQAAQATFDEAATLASEKVEPDHRCHSYILKERGALLLARGDSSGAQRDLQDARRLLEKQDDLERVADTNIYLGEAALRSNQFDEARSEFNAALTLRGKIFPAKYWAIADARCVGL